MSTQAIPAPATSTFSLTQLVNRISKLPWGELTVVIAVLAILFAMVVPLPAFLLDILISFNLAISTVVLLVSLYITKPSDFSLFPTTLLLLTLFRLALNVSSARLILLSGNSGTHAAGDVIDAFGTFVVGGNYVIGVVIFLVLIAIQYLVINHGAVRISEVTARFTLDAMPGKQMSIDSDLSAGLIDESEARKRRSGLAAEAEFYGAMDGASRFTQRDAIASTLITTINILAGFLIGVLQHDMDLKRALQTYTVLTIGDGLVTVIPALMVSVSGGLIVTRASSEAKLGADVQQQLLSRPEPLALAAGVLVTMALIPGLPKFPFLAVGGLFGTAAWKLMQKRKLQASVSQQAPAPVAIEPVDSLLRIDPIALEVGLGLVRFLEGGPQSPLLRRIAALRKQLATELGYLLPPVRVTDNLSLKSREYAISLKGVEITRFELMPGHELALQPEKVRRKINGVTTKEPAFQLPALWVAGEQLDLARTNGYTVVDSLSIMGTHLGETIRRFAFETFSRQDSKRFLDRVAEENPKAVEDLVPKLLALVTVHKVLQNLLRERVSIRDATSIVESLGEAALMTKNSVLLTEYVRQSIRRSLVKPYLTASGVLPVYFLDPGLEKTIESAVEHSETSSHVTLAPQTVRDITDRITQLIRPGDSSVVLLTTSSIRFFVRQMVENVNPNLVVVSHSEVPSGVKVTQIATVQ